MARGPGKEALWKERVRKATVFLFFLSPVPNVPYDGGCSHSHLKLREKLLSVQKNEKAGENPGYFFVCCLSSGCFTSEPEPVTGNAWG